ncbi:nodulation protein U [Streptomyces sp. NBC_01136]|uniref:carbamoyltransferase N-terminal domain-containing protein n=1 Tax=Streptomyces sp. NBC_01136 TaxID=2903754 RepID=UPI00386C123A|nr:nodulation protein U [Streptomyces sp. NBC_01136]
MLICGVKTTHDGGVALIEDGRLVFSTEMEKLGNNERYAKIKDFATVFELLAEHGYRPEDIDHFVLDGWYKTHKIQSWHGQEFEVVLAPYRRGLLDDDLLRAFPGSIQDLPYLSFTHYAGHVASGYCASPFSRAGQGSYVLSWDGWMFPFLYYVDGQSRKVTSCGPLMPVIGDSYLQLGQLFAPFDEPIEYPHILGLAGKIMAYIALGEARQEAVEHIDRTIDSAFREVLGDRPDDDRFYQVGNGIEILKRIKKNVALPGVEPADMLASIHHALSVRLVQGVREKVATADFPDRNLVVVGGCGLNIKWNSALRDSGVFDNVWVPPFPNDSGSSIGTACAAMLSRTERAALDWDVYSGPALRDSTPLPGWREESCDLRDLARLLHEGDEPVVFLNGRAEIGPRALGNRSILAPAGSPKMKDLLNEVKDREFYRPVAPICLEEFAPGIFSPGTPDPYMLFDHTVRDSWKDRVPAVCHLDGTARLQTVNRDENEAVFDLLTHYHDLSGIPLLCNTSANLKGSGFFPDVRSAMEWGRVRLIWSDGRLFTRAH